MGDRLVGKKIGRAIQFQQAFKSKRDQIVNRTCEPDKLLNSRRG